MALQSTTALAAVTLQSASSQVTFNGIPSIYRDLIVVIAGTSSSAQGARMTINSDSSAAYNTVRMYGIGSGSGTTNAFGGGTFGYIGDMFPSQTSLIIQLTDASASNKHKSWVYRMDNAANYTMVGAARYESNTAISSLRFELNNAATYSAGTTFSIYGRIA